MTASLNGGSFLGMCLLDPCVGCWQVLSMVGKLREHAVKSVTLACCEAC